MQISAVHEVVSMHPENYSDYFPGKEKGYYLPTLKTEEMVLSNDELFAKILREFLTI